MGGMIARADTAKIRAWMHHNCVLSRNQRFFLLPKPYAEMADKTKNNNNRENFNLHSVSSKSFSGCRTQNSDQSTCQGGMVNL